MDFLSKIIDHIWGPPVVFVLIGTGLFLSLRLIFIQIRYLYLGIRITFGFKGPDFKEKTGGDSSKGDISPFQALTTALSATIGTGNIVGVAGAILLGGPGAVFWMWVTAFLGMATKYSECFLAVHYRESTSSGFAGGPMYYIQKGLKLRWLGVFFAVTTLIAAFGLGNMVQSNVAAGELYSTDLNIPRGVSAFFIAAVTGLVIIGGIKRIGKVTGFIVPFMSVFYLIGCFYIVLTSIESVPGVFSMIFKYAFEPLPALTGSAIGFWQTSAMVGVRRGLFSNEAGLGSAPMAAASAKTTHPVKQGLVSMMGPFIDTLVICSLTAIVILIGMENKASFILEKAVSSKGLSVANELQPSIGEITNNFSVVWSGIVSSWGERAGDIQDILVSSVFYSYMGDFGKSMITVGILFFSISTIIGWFFYSDRALIYLGLQKYGMIYRVLWVSLTFLGGYTANITLIWHFADIANGFMAIPNLIALLLLSPIIVRETKNFFKKYPYRFDLIVHIYLLFLYILPKHTLSRIVGYFARWNAPRAIMMPVLRSFSQIYRVNMDEAEQQLKDYRSFNKFFTRNLKNKARSIESEKKAIVSPVDGRILNFGKIRNESIIQVKGIDLKIKDIFNQHKLYKKFEGGIWMTIYLAPKDYHKIHSPVEGDIIASSYAPGRLLPVNDLAVYSVKNLFSKNERVTTYTETKFGLTALTKVGATIVGRIKLNYDDSVNTNGWLRFKKEREYPKGIKIKKGEELGRFEMGSTVILFIEKGRAEWLDLEEKQTIQYGQPIGTFY